MKKIDLNSLDMTPTISGQQTGNKPVISWRKRLRKRLCIKSLLAREMLSETIGTFILMVFTIGAAAQFTFGGEGAGGNWGNFQASSMGVAMAVYVSNVSGSHINPAVTFMFAITGRMKAWKAPFFMLAQYLGAFLASACVFGVYYDALNDFDGGNRQITGPKATAGIFATYPKDFLSVPSAFFDQVFCTALLGCGVFSVMDRRNVMPELSLMPLVISMLILTISASLGFNGGNAMNPARDLSPRIFTAIAGWGPGVFSYANYTWFWIPVVGSYVGAPLGAFFYLLCISVHHHPEDKTILETTVKEENFNLK